MGRPLAAVLFTFAAIALACAGPAEEPVADEPVVEEPGQALSEPWGSLSLPVSNGAVLYSDATGMMVSHTQPFQETSDAYAGALRAGGYSVAGDYSEPNFTAMAFQKGSSNIGLMVSGDTSGALVLLEDLGRVPEQDSNLASAKRGERKMPPAAARRGERPKRVMGERPTKSSGGSAGAGGASGSGTRTLTGSGGGKGGGGSSGGSLGGGGSGGSSGGSLGGSGSGSSGGSLGK
jgi:hypothetical protein